MTLSPDGKEIVASIDEAESSHLVLFEAATGKIRWRHKTSFSNQPMFVADGSRICYFGADPSSRTVYAVYWLDAATGKRMPQVMLADHRETALRPDGKVLAAGGLDGLVCQYDLESRTRLDGASADPPVEVTEVQFSADGSKVRGWGDRWYEWDMKTGTQTRLTPRAAPNSPGPYAVSRDQRWIVTPVGEQSRRIQRVELVELKPAGQVHPLPADEPPYSFRFSPDGRLMISKSSMLSIVDPRSGKLLQEIRAGENEAVVASEDGTTALVVNSNGTTVKAVHWNLVTGERSGEWSGQLSRSPNVNPKVRQFQKLTPDGQVFVVCFSAGEPEQQNGLFTSFFDARNGRLLSSWKSGLYWMGNAFSSDNRALVVSTERALEIREIATGGRRMLFAEHAITGSGFSPDGRFLAVASQPQPIALYDLVGDPSAHMWDPARVERIWESLGLDDAERSFQEMRILRANPAEAARFVKVRMKVPAPPKGDWIAARIRDLDAPAYRDRERATADLSAVGDIVIAPLRDALKSASAEAQPRIQGVLEQIDSMTPDKLRAIRACEVLEGIGTREAIAVLADWAKGAPGATLTREAVESLERLKKR